MAWIRKLKYEAKYMYLVLLKAEKHSANNKLEFFWTEWESIYSGVMVFLLYYYNGSSKSNVNV